MTIKRVIIIMGVLLTIAVIGASTFLAFQKKPEHISRFALLTSVDAPIINPDVNLAKISDQAAKTGLSSIQENLCQAIRLRYQNNAEVKQVEKVNLRFVNTHKKIDGEVYRLRFFYKDSSENEVPSYLLYKENHNDDDILIEKSQYKKGKKYLTIEKAQGEVIYSEEGINIGTEQDLFLHYENNVLKDLQGIVPIQGSQKSYVECRF